MNLDLAALHSSLSGKIYLISEPREHTRGGLWWWPKARKKGLLLLLLRPLLLLRQHSGDAEALRGRASSIGGCAPIADGRDGVFAWGRRRSRTRVSVWTARGTSGTPATATAPNGSCCPSSHGIGVQHPSAWINRANWLLSGNSEVAASWICIPAFCHHQCYRPTLNTHVTDTY